MKKWLSQHLKTLDPHLGRRESVHPCDHAYAVIVAHDLLHIINADIRGLNSRKQFKTYSISKLLVEELHHFAAIRSNLLKALLAVQILTARYEIQFFHDFYPFIVVFCVNKYLYCKQLVHIMYSTFIDLCQ